jgi:hypothetical protein
VQTLERFIAALRRCCQSLPDRRVGRNTSYAMADFALAAFAPCFMQSPSFLAHQRHLETTRGRSNCQTLFGVEQIPGDSQVRAMLDPIEPVHFFPVFADVIAALRETGGLEAMRVLGGHTLIALDGTEFHCSDKIQCPNCSHRQRGRKDTEYFHTLLAASIVAPGHNRAVPLQPEFVAPQDGHEKQDCESRAGRRWLAAHGTHTPHCGRSTSATICSRVSRSAKLCTRRAATSCSSANRTRIRRSKNSAPASCWTNGWNASGAAGNGRRTATVGYATCHCAATPRRSPSIGWRSL